MAPNPNRMSFGDRKKPTSDRLPGSWRYVAFGELVLSGSLIANWVGIESPIRLRRGHGFDGAGPEGIAYEVLGVAETLCLGHDQRNAITAPLC